MILQPHVPTRLITPPGLLLPGMADFERDRRAIMPFPAASLARGEQPASVPDGLNDVSAPAPSSAMAFWNLFPASYSGNCLKIERTSDNTTQDIGFDGSGILDTAAIASFCGASNGRIHTWYDQLDGGTGIFANTAGTRPVIYNGSTMVTDGSGKIGWAMGSVIAEFADTAGSANLAFMLRHSSPADTMVTMGNRSSNNFYMGLGENGSTGNVDQGSGSSALGTHYKDGTKITAVTNRDTMYDNFMGQGSEVRWCGVRNSATAYNFCIGVYDGTTGSTFSMNSGYVTGYALKYTSALSDTEVADIDTYLAANIP